MARYFIEGKQVTEEEARKVMEDNNKYMESGDFNDMLKCKYISIV